MCWCNCVNLFHIFYFSKNDSSDLVYGELNCAIIQNFEKMEIYSVLSEI